MDDQETKYCPECGQELRTEAGFCDRCGAEQTAGGTAAGDSAAPTAASSTDDGTYAVVTRRTLFAGAVTLAIAGGGVGLLLTSGGSSQERVPPEEWDSRGTEETTAGEVITGHVTLEDGQYTAQGFFGIGAPSLGWAVENVSGGAVDVWATPKDEFDSFEDGDEFRYNTSLSESGITSSDSAEGRVDGSDDWYVIFDNTGRESEADDRVEFDVGVGIGG